MCGPLCAVWDKLWSVLFTWYSLNCVSLSLLRRYLKACYCITNNWHILKHMAAGTAVCSQGSVCGKWSSGSNTITGSHQLQRPRHRNWPDFEVLSLNLSCSSVKNATMIQKLEIVVFIVAAQKITRSLKLCVRASDRILRYFLVRVWSSRFFCLSIDVELLLVPD